MPQDQPHDQPDFAMEKAREDAASEAAKCAAEPKKMVSMSHVPLSLALILPLPLNLPLHNCWLLRLQVRNRENQRAFRQRRDERMAGDHDGTQGFPRDFAVWEGRRVPDGEHMYWHELSPLQVPKEERCPLPSVLHMHTDYVCLCLGTG